MGVGLKQLWRSRWIPKHSLEILY